MELNGWSLGDLIILTCLLVAGGARGIRASLVGDQALYRTSVVVVLAFDKLVSNYPSSGLY
ncbi:hypothetical protein CRG98_032069 [Punica granatum]|uniref:Uncharacterized protein n=1 Tax=Punica granatum TaxID=22663 RepID=A0A2I0IU01_PUNGR|nr:hypothetical protein CRG98_032069 [Punica granatum]